MKIAIVARGETALNAPFFDPQWRVWGMPWVKYPRVDLLFDVHTQRCFDEGTGDDLIIYPADAPVYCEPCREHRYQEFERRRLPLELIRARYPGAPLENTICYQMAYAMFLGAEEIGLWGVHMLAIIEHIWEKAGVFYWIGRAEGEGVKVTLAPGSPLMMSLWADGRYGVSARARIPLEV